MTIHGAPPTLFFGRFDIVPDFDTYMFSDHLNCRSSEYLKEKTKLSTFCKKQAIKFIFCINFV